MNRLTLLVGSALMALLLASCGQNAPKKAEPQQSQEMMQQAGLAMLVVGGAVAASTTWMDTFTAKKKVLAVATGLSVLGLVVLWLA